MKKRAFLFLCALLLLTGCRKEQIGVFVVTYGETPPGDTSPAPPPEPEPVSYTHLRAHET